MVASSIGRDDEITYRRTNYSDTLLGYVVCTQKQTQSSTNMWNFIAESMYRAVVNNVEKMLNDIDFSTKFISLLQDRDSETYP